MQAPLHIERPDRPAVFQFHDPALGRIARDFPGRLDRVEQRQVVRQKPVLEERENAGGGADLQRIGERAHVRVADEQMQPAIFPIIGQRLIARVDDRAVELHPLINVVDDMIGPLAELEIDRLFRRRHFEIEGEGIGLADPARAGENLARGKKGEERAEGRGGELRLALHQVIFVAAEGGAGVVIDVVLDERNRARPRLTNREPTGEADRPPDRRPRYRAIAGTPARRIRCAPCRGRSGRR